MYSLFPLRSPRLSCRRLHLRIERLDERALPSVSLAEPVYPVVMAGALKGSPSDTPADRVDPNTTDSPFAGVGSILVTTRRTTFMGTGTPIDSRHILTAAHVVDLNNDGKFNARDGTQGIYFVLNFGGDMTSKIAVSQVDIDPDFTGFNRPAVNDDIAILTLAEDLPEGVPIYQLPSTNLAEGTIVTMVGYGRSGDGARGFSTLASATVKRVGENTVDAFYWQDDRGQPVVNEVFRFDFDAATGNGPLGSGTLGNDIETQLGPGDSGGPSFAVTPAGYVVVGVNAYVQGGRAPRFSSMGGGMNVFAYLGFIESIITPMSFDQIGAESPQTGPTAKPPITSGPLPAEIVKPVPRGKNGIGVGARPISSELASVVDSG